MAETEPPDDLSTKTLLRRGRAGDASALERLFHRLFRRVRRWAHGRLPKPARRHTDTVDVVQDAAIGVWRRLDRLDLTSPGDLEAYLRQAAKNRILDEVRRCAREPRLEPVDSNQVSAEPSPVEHVIGRQAMQRYRAALGKLTPEEQKCLVARLEMGYSFEEVASLLGKPSPDAARMAVMRAHKQLTKHLSEQ